MSEIAFFPDLNTTDIIFLQIFFSISLVSVIRNVLSVDMLVAGKRSVGGRSYANNLFKSAVYLKHYDEIEGKVIRNWVC